MDQEGRDVLAGAAAGLAATIAMSGALAVAARAGLLQEPPPRAIVRRLLAGLSPEAVDAGAVLAHLGYGSSAGVVHRALLGAPGPAASVLYALGLYIGSYEGWVPVIRALPPAHLDDRRRQATMLAAHLVYGFALGVLGRRRRRRLAPARRP
ncbi:MAG: hypothetical protein ACTHJL_05175 [Amnibacterium sp.]